jgi:lipoprotein-anchoring transpeptidase ErfK/SrfK/flagellar biosynthesis/type III secretory pathway protein FliH
MNLRGWRRNRHIFAFASLAASVFISDLSAGPASAQGAFSFFDGEAAAPRMARHRRHRSNKDRIHRKAKAADAPLPNPGNAAGAVTPEPPLFLIVSIADQQVSIYNHAGLVARSMVSTGIAGHPTPRGVFTIIGRERYHRSNIYSGAPMPLMQRVTWSGIAMHVGVVPGHPASHGCIRLPAQFAARLWGMTKIGERVIISPRETGPVDFVHPALPTPKMVAPGPAETTVAAKTSTPLAAEPRLNPAQYAEQLRAKAVTEAAAAAKRAKEAAADVVSSKAGAAQAAKERDAAEAMNASALSRAEKATAFLEAARAGRDASLLVTARSGAVDGVRVGKAEAAAATYEKAEAAKDAAQAALADASARLEAAKGAFAARDAQLTDALKRLSDATAASQAAAIAETQARRRTMPVSVLISRKDRRIYVRQGLAPLFDAPVSLRDPEAPLGSHVYIATAATGDGTALQWSVVSLPPHAPEARSERKSRRAVDIDSGTSTQGPASGPAEALERVELPQDIRDRIAERLWLGASIIVSDLPLSGETGNVGTDITVKLR